MTTYKIIRFHFNSAAVNEKVIKTGLTLEEAQAYCKDPETSSSTAKLPENLRYTREHGAWFDGYEVHHLGKSGVSIFDHFEYIEEEP